MPSALRSWASSWTNLAPPAALVALAVLWGSKPGAFGLTLAAVLLGGAVLAAVHHAEVVAHRVGEPFGSLLLAVAVTIIEVGLILTLMSSGSSAASTLARDTVFAAVMITCNGIIGVSLLAGAIRHHTISFNAEGSGGALATVLTLATVCLVLPTYTTTRSGPEFSPAQLAFAAVASLGLYALFVFTQTVRHRDFFLPVSNAVVPDVMAGQTGHTPTTTSGTTDVEAADGPHAERPSDQRAWASLGLLVASLVGVVGLAKIESAPIEDGVESLGLPHAVVGVVIALLVLLPESIAAVRAATRNRMQISLNLGLGSAMASIGLTIPAIAISTVWLDGPLHLGLEPVHQVLLVLTAAVSVLTVVPGRATRLQGGVHLAVLAAYLVLTVLP